MEAIAEAIVFATLCACVCFLSFLFLFGLWVFGKQGNGK